jgi:hypothetical protein
MAEYYGYAERDANSYVDWGKLGQNLTETVETAYKLREEKKQKLDEIMQKNYAELANSPTGQNQDINSAIVQHADNSKQYLLQINKLLKAGILQPKDYTLINQNLGEDTKALFNNAKNWQTAYGKILERNKNNEGSKVELDISADVAAFGKFKDMQFMINPTTGRLSAAEMITGPDGEQIKGDSKSMQQINVLMNQPIDKYKLTDKLVNAEKTIGEFVNDTLVRGQIQKQGSITKVEDKAIKETFTAAKNTFVSEIMANPFNVMSILADYVGTVPGTSTPYKASTKPTDRGNEGVIMYVDPDGDGSYQPELTEQQRKAAEEYVTNQFVGMIDRKVTRQVVSQAQRNDEPQYVREGREAQEKKDAAVGAWDKLRSGTVEEKQAAAQTLVGTTIAQESGLIDIDLVSQPGKVILRYDDPKKNRTIPISEKGAEWSAIGVELHGENDVNKARKAAGNSWAKPIIKDYTNVRASRQGSNFSSQMSEYTSQVVPQSIVEDDYAKTASLLNERFSNLGFTVKGDYEVGITGASDYVIITAPDGSKSEKIYIDNTDNIGEIEAFLVSKLDNSKAANFFTSTPAAAGASNSGGVPR